MIRYLTNNTLSPAHKQGVTVAENTITAIEEARFTMEIYSILLIVSGGFNIRVNNTDYQVGTGDFLYMPIGSVVHIFNSPSSTTIYSYSFTDGYCCANLLDTEQALAFQRSIHNQVVLLRLSATTYVSLETFYRLLRIKQAESVHAPDDEIKKLYFNLMICEIIGLCKEDTGYESYHNIRNQNTLGRFIQLVRENFKQQHSVQFYAEALCVSAGHLTKIIKHASSKTVKQFIEDALIAEAKNLLNTERLSILDIAEELQFSTVSAFCKFFKKQTMMTPTAFRNSCSV
ncbi:helix-turn-helix domain-containing protein [Flavobacterium rhizosphaerae]|uniref:AraC family transcriptional regulator n=1 Tax=Flavobacterium rhizosphaerae TaxID=3163298 RepID=A0ABW8YW09_9FLAO